MVAGARPPWYAFLYRILGAHGTFWLWVVTVVALWWTWHGALVRILDREPERRSIAELATSHEIRRWVVLPGLMVDVNPALLNREESAPGFAPTSILIEPTDPAATFWRTTRVLADTDAGVGAGATRTAAAALGGPAAYRILTARTVVRDTLIARRTELRNNAAARLPRSQMALIVLADGAAAEASRVISQPGDVGGDGANDTGDYALAFAAWRDGVRASVSVAAPQGLLDEAPQALLDRLANDPGLRLSPKGLRIGRKPRDAELYVFCGAALCFLFLATGFYGVSRAHRPSDGSP
jgi:hypothetical protein